MGMRNFIGAILKTGSGSVANLLLGMASVKVIAILLGPSGVGLFSLLRQAMFTLATVGFGGQTALVQGIASKENAEKDAYIRTTFWLFVWGSILTVVLIESLSPLIAGWLFGKDDTRTIKLIRWIAMPVVLSNAYIFLKSLINGFRAIGRLARVEVMGPFFMLLLIYPVCIMVGRGYALAFIWILSVSQVVMIVASLRIIQKNDWMPALFGKKRIDKEASLYFFRIAGTTLITAMLGTSAILVVRATIMRHGGLHEAGLFDLAWTLSGSYVMLLLSSFGTYYMPVLSGTSESAERLVLIKQVIRLSILLMVPMIVAVVVVKPFVVTVLYTKEFIPALEIVRWMLIGDYFKISAWVLTTTVVANADMQVYFWGETFWYVGFVLLSLLAMLGFGELQGIAVAFLMLYICITIYYLKYAEWNYGLRLTSDVVIPWVVGLAIVIMASMQTWNVRMVDWGMSLFWIVVSIIFVWMTLKREERLTILKVFSMKTGKRDL